MATHRLGLALAAVLGFTQWSEATVTGRCDRSSEGPYLRDGAGNCQATLSSVLTTVEVWAPVVQVASNHTFTNDKSYPIHGATASLALPAGAVLMGFTVWEPGEETPLVGEVQSKVHGSAAPVCPRHMRSLGIYDAQPFAGTPRVKLRQPLQPGAGVTVRLEYALELTAKVQVPGDAVFQLALTVPTGSRRHQLASGTAMFEASIRAESGVKVSVPSASSTLEVSSSSSGSGENGAGVGVTQTTFRSKSLQDIIVEIEPHAASKPQAEAWPSLSVVLQQHPRTGLLAAAVTLPAVLSPQSYKAYEFVLLLDRSFSSQGPRMGRLQAVAQTFIRSVPKGARVNLLGFKTGSSLTPLFKGTSQELDKASFEKAVAYIGGKVSSDPSARGTGRSGPGLYSAVADQSSPVQEVLSAAIEGLQREPGTQLRMVLLTDRHPGDAEEAIQYVDKHCPVDCRVSVLGVGWGASSPFVEGMAKAGGGTHAFVAERGGTQALEKALVLLLAEAMQPDIHNVTVDWDAILPGTDKEAHQSFSPAASSSDATQDAAALSRFVSQGGLREPKQVNIDKVGAGGGHRVMALALLGTEVLSDAPAVLRLQAMVAGNRVSLSTPLSLPSSQHKGAALHALSAARLAEALGREAAKDETGASASGDLAWQQRALGLAYGVATPQTHWVVSSSTSSDSTPSVEAVQCTAESRVGEDLGDDDELAGGRSSSQPQPPPRSSKKREPELSMRNLPPQGSGDGQKSTGQRKKGSLLSLLDCCDLGSSLSLRHLGTRSPLDFGKRFAESYRADSEQLGAGLAMRDFGRVGRIPDLVALGSTLSLGGRQPSWSLDSAFPQDKQHPWQDPQLGDDASTYDPFGDFWAPPFDSRSTRDQTHISGSLSVAGPARRGSSLRPDVRDASQDRSSSSLAALSSTLSTMDFDTLASSLALRSVCQPGRQWGARSQQPGVFSLLDGIFLGSSLSLGAYGRQWRSMALLGNQRLRGLEDMEAAYDDFGFRRDPYESDDFVWGRKDQSRDTGKKEQPSLSMRSLSRMGSSISAADLALSAERAAAGLSKKLSAVDFASLGASLSLRPASRPSFGRGFGQSGDFTDLASSLSLRRFSSSPWGSQSRLGAGYLEDLDLYPSSDRDMLGDLYGEFGVGRRQSSKDESPSSQPAAPTWVAVALAGGLLAPLLGLARTGSSCRPRLEQVRILWNTSAGSPLAAASLLLATGPAGGRQQTLGEIPPPREGEDSDARFSVHVSYHCELTVRRAVRDTSKASLAAKGPGAVDRQDEDIATPLLRMTLPDLMPAEEGAAQEVSSATDLRKALRARRDHPAQVPSPPWSVASGGETSSSATPGHHNYIANSDAEQSSYQQLVAAQSFDGSFQFKREGGSEDQGDLDLERVSSAGLSAPHLVALITAWEEEAAAGQTTEDTSSPSSVQLARTAAQTAAALAALHRRHRGRSAGWALLAARAEAWLGEVAETVCGGLKECIESATLSVAAWSEEPALAPGTRGARWW